MPWDLLWLDLELLFEDRPRREFRIAYKAQRSGACNGLVKALDLIGLHNEHRFDLEEEDVITALQCALLGSAATGELSQIWAAQTSRAKAQACPSPNAAALLRVAWALAAGQDEPDWIYDLLARGEDLQIRRGDICGVLGLARDDFDDPGRNG